MPIPPRRYIEGRTVVSTWMPRVRVTVGRPWRFLDRLRFPLYGVAEVDAFVFIDMSCGGRLLVIQFEGYLDTNTHTYDYSDAELTTLDGKPFHVDTTAVDLGQPPPADSDMGQVLGLLRSRDVALPSQTMVQRFIHLPNEARRHELLILYAEPLEPGDPAAARAGARRRGREAFTIAFAPP